MKTLSIEANAASIHAAIVKNAITLIPVGDTVSKEEFRRVGADFLSMLNHRKQLLPAFWRADGDEKENVIEVLNEFAELTPKLYYSVRFDPTASTAIALANSDATAIAHEAHRRNQWINRFKTISPSDAFVEDIGSMFYDMRAYEIERSIVENRPMAQVIVASATAS